MSQYLNMVNTCIPQWNLAVIYYIVQKKKKKLLAKEVKEEIKRSEGTNLFLSLCT